MRLGFRQPAAAAVAAFVFFGFVTGDAWAQTPPEKPVAPKSMKIGDTLNGQLTAMRMRARGKAKAGTTYQLVSEPRRLPAPAGLCNLETGPETFEIVTTSDAQAAQLKSYVGKDISLKVAEVSCAEQAGQMSDALITKWSVVARP